ncbi:hypothetical protein ACJX0J_023776, partial [Zea mays]
AYVLLQEDNKICGFEGEIFMTLQESEPKTFIIKSFYNKEKTSSDVIFLKKESDVDKKSFYLDDFLLDFDKREMNIYNNKVSIERTRSPMVWSQIQRNICISVYLSVEHGQGILVY